MTALRPWREVAIPHSDVLKGTFQQAEFAADISAVCSGKAPDIYKDAALFFDRTYITEGMLWPPRQRHSSAEVPRTRPQP